VACVEELQSLVTHLIHFTHRKIQVIAKPIVVLLSTKMSCMSEHFAYCYTSLLCVGPAGTPVLVYSTLLIRNAISGQWFGLASDELLKNQTGGIFV
jgi:hypothetical protein